MTNFKDKRLIDFVAESNRIEGIHRPPTLEEIAAHEKLLGLPRIVVADLEEFVYVVARAGLRCRPGLNVRVGNHIAPDGGPDIEQRLEELLELIEGAPFMVLQPFRAHQHYEVLHPFMDGNGRSGRALWAWHMDKVQRDPFALPFLHRWYYQSLDAAR